jgi:hypothetical protein
MSMKLFLRVLLFLPLISLSQNDKSNQIPIDILLDSINNQIIYQTNTSIHRIDISSLKTISSIKIKHPSPSDYRITLNKNELLFLEKRGGDILILNSNDSLKKKDNSNIVNFFIGTNSFVRKDTIFKHGGYGYWTLSNFLTYFEDLSNEWQIYPISASTSIPPGVINHTGFYTNDSYYFFGGNSMNETGTRTITKENDGVWRFNFNTKKWKFLGTLLRNSSIKTLTTFKKKSNILLLDDQKILYEIDILKNTLIKYKLAPILYGFMRGIKPIYFRNFVYFVDESKNVNKVAISEITKEPIIVSKFYDTQNITEKIILASGFIILLIVLFFVAKRYANSKTLKLLDNGVRYKNKFIELDNLSISIIKMVEPQDIELSKVFNLVKKDHLSKIQNERIKNQYIDQINLQLSVLTGIKEDFLIVSKSNFDKRYKIIRLNKAVYGNLL